MADLLVKLYKHDQSITDRITRLNRANIQIRRCLVPEKEQVTNWVRNTFGTAWSSECAVSFTQQPVACFIAVESSQIIGFSCYDTTFKGFIGPIGVNSNYQSKGIGKTLMTLCMQAMAAQGYAYAIIGNVRETVFFSRVTDVLEIPDSSPGPYDGMLKP